MSPAERRVGMDHPHYPFSPLPARPPLRWPGGASLALSVIVLLDHVEVDPPPDAVQAPLTGSLGASRRPYPWHTLLAQRDYGLRVGIFRVLEVLGSLGVPVGVAIDAMTAERCPYVVDRCLAQGAEVIAHGISLSRLITSRIGEQAEREHIGESLARVAAATGQQPLGWFSPEQSESERTPALLDAAGVGYVCDWPNDEQPYVMATPRGLVSLPTTFGLDDAHLFLTRMHTPEQYALVVERWLAGLVADGATSGRCATLVVRPWLTGQPFRIGALEDALGAVLAGGGVWPALPRDVVAAFRAGAQ